MYESFPAIVDKLRFRDDVLAPIRADCSLDEFTQRSIGIALDAVEQILELASADNSQPVLRPVTVGASIGLAEGELGRSTPNQVVVH
ncbi:hypothetical protein D3C87_1687470 [compost metagenome]